MECNFKNISSLARQSNEKLSVYQRYLWKIGEHDEKNI